MRSFGLHRPDLVGKGLSTLQFRILHGAEGASAIALRRQIYSVDLIPDPEDDLDNLATHIAACDANGAIVAAFRIVGPEQRPYDFEHILSLDSLVAGGGRPAMIGRLCVRQDHRNVGRSTPILYGLLAEAILFARVTSISDYFLYTFDHLRTFYARGGFAEAQVTVEHPHWGRLHLMHMPVIVPTARSPASRFSSSSGTGD